MLDGWLRDALVECAPSEYLRACQRKGRAGIDSGLKQRAVSLLERSRFGHGSVSVSGESRTALYAIHDLFFSEGYGVRNARPNYEAYTNIRIIDRYVDFKGASSLGERLRLARRALSVVIRGWHSHEAQRLLEYDSNTLSHAILGYAVQDGEGTSVAHLRKRELELRALLRQVEHAGIPGLNFSETEARQAGPTEWHYLAERPDMFLAAFSCLPQSLWHDEHLFLRTIHATEICFAGILACLQTLPVVTAGEDFGLATEVLKRALHFSGFLIDLFAVFETMPVDHFFNGFREDTGDASAIQSVKFQMVEVLTRGMSGSKRQALSRQTTTGFAATWTPPEEVTLVGLCRAAARPNVVGGRDFIDAAMDLDQHLFQWRNKHFGIAKRYLPMDAVGTGSEGISYLKDSLSSRLTVGEAGIVRVETMDPKKNQELARVTDAYRKRMKDAKAAVLVGRSIDPGRLAEHLARSAADLPAVMAANAPSTKNVLDAYQNLYGAHPYQVARQIERFRKTPRLPDSPPPAFLLSLELRSGILMGVHNAARISGPIVFDTASQGEAFDGLMGGVVTCAQDEPILRDDKDIFASILQGPDKRTAIPAMPTDSGIRQDWCLMLFGAPGCEARIFDQAFTEAQAAMESLAAGGVLTWRCDES